MNIFVPKSVVAFCVAAALSTGAFAAGEESPSSTASATIEHTTKMLPITEQKLEEFNEALEIEAQVITDSSAEVAESSSNQVDTMLAAN